jgi:hypothetical protein
MGIPPISLKRPTQHLTGHGGRSPHFHLGIHYFFEKPPLLSDERPCGDNLEHSIPSLEGSKSRTRSTKPHDGRGVGFPGVDDAKQKNTLRKVIRENVQQRVTYWTLRKGHENKRLRIRKLSLIRTHYPGPLRGDLTESGFMRL